MTDAGFAMAPPLEPASVRGGTYAVLRHKGPYADMRAAYDALDDYPVFVLRAALAVADEPGSLGIVLGGSGNGELIAANKVPGIRAAYASSVELAQLARQHNDAQVISMGGRFTDIETGCAIADAFLTTSFSGDARHARRLAMVTDYELDGSLPEA